MIPDTPVRNRPDRTHINRALVPLLEARPHRVHMSRHPVEFVRCVGTAGPAIPEGARIGSVCKRRGIRSPRKCPLEPLSCGPQLPKMYRRGDPFQSAARSGCQRPSKVPSALQEWLSVRPPTSTGWPRRAEEPDLRSLEPELRVQMRWTTKACSNRSKCGIWEICLRSG